MGARPVFAAQAVLGLVALGAVLLRRGGEAGAAKPARGGASGGILADAAARADLGVAALAAGAGGVMRGGFSLLVPLVVARSGVGAAAGAFALTNGVGLAFCWVGGHALDHLGRKASAVPSLALFSASLALLARALGEEPMPWALEASALLCGLAEAVGAGFKGSTKADFVARARQRGIAAGGDGTVESARFAAALDNALDSIGIVYPLVLAYAAQAWGGPCACYVGAGLGAVAVVWVLAFFPETLE